MKTNFLFATAFLAISVLQASAQTKVQQDKNHFSIDFPKGVLKLAYSNVSVVGYDGDQVILEKDKSEDDNANDDAEDARAKGLQEWSASGLKDNTGLGFSYVLSGKNELLLKPISAIAYEQTPIILKVPNKIHLTISNKEVVGQGEIKVTNFGGELEIQARNENVFLKNVTGPLTVNTIFGRIEAVLSEPLKGPVSLVSANDLVDLSIPKESKVNLNLTSLHGKIYLDPLLPLAKSKYTAVATYDDENAEDVPNANETGITTTTTTTKNKTVTTIQTDKKKTTIASADSKGTTLVINGNKMHYQSGNIVIDTLLNNDNEVSTGIGSNTFLRKRGQTMRAAMNGGGVNVSVSSNWKNIYIRKQ